MDTPLFDGELVHARRMIYTPSAFAKSNLVHLQEVGQLQDAAPMPAPGRGWPPTCFLWSKAAAARWNMRARPVC